MRKAEGRGRGAASWKIEANEKMKTSEKENSTRNYEAKGEDT